MSGGLRLISWGMRWVLKPVLARSTQVRGVRRGLGLASVGFFRPWGVARGGDTALMRLRPKASKPLNCIVYFHGGGYVAGSPWTHRGLIGRIALATGAELMAPRYPLAPEHPAPAAFDHGLAVIMGLLAQGLRPEAMFLAGDSAGGGLAAALADALTRRGVAFAGTILLSPWADLTMSGASLEGNAGMDAMLPASRIRDLVTEVRGALPLDDPRISPLFGTGGAPPPTLILCGEAEILLDDSRRLAVALRARGGQVDLHVEPGAPHVYPFLAPYVPEARAALRQIGQFVRANSLTPPRSDS